MELAPHTVEKVKRDGPMWASAHADGGCSWNDTDTSHDILCPLPASAERCELLQTGLPPCPETEEVELLCGVQTGNLEQMEIVGEELGAMGWGEGPLSAMQPT